MRLKAALFLITMLGQFSPTAEAQAPTPAQRAVQMAEVFDGQALRVILCGTSSPLPDADRAKPCTVVIAGANAWVVDTGPESWETLALLNFPAARIKGVFLTHFHSDHIGGLGEFRLQTLVAGRDFRLPVYGPQGVGDVVRGFNLAYASDDQHRFDHHGPGIIALKSAPLVASEFGQSFRRKTDAEEIVLEADGLKVTAFQVDHDPVTPAVGYRFDYLGRSVTISGDTAKSANLVENAKGSDVLIGESLVANLIGIGAQQASAGGNTRIAKILTDIVDYHATPVEMAEMANGAGVGLLVYTHFVPSGPASLSPLYFAGVSAVREATQWVAGYDMLRIDLPKNSTEILVVDMQ